MIGSCISGNRLDPFPRTPASVVRASLTLFLLIASSHPLASQDKLVPVFHFNRLTAADGLPSNEIRSPVVRDHNGYIWVGTENGLARYDGYGCKIYRNDPSDRTSLSSNTVMSLLEDSKQRLWIGTWESGLSLYDPGRDRFVNFRPRPGDSTWLQARSVLEISEDRSGNIWLGGPSEAGGVVQVRFPPETRSPGLEALDTTVRFTTYPLGTPRNIVKRVLEWGDGRILACSDRGLHVFDPTIKRFTLLQLADPHRGLFDTLRVSCIAKDHRDNLWVGTVTAGLFRVELHSGNVLSLRHRDGDPSSIGNDFIMQIVEDLNGNLWIATAESIDLLSPTTGQRIPYLTFGRTPVGSEDQRLAVDGTGTLWISTGEDGVFWLSPKSARFPNFSVQDSDGSPRSFGIVEQDRNGAFWFSSKGTLYHIDPDDLRTVRTIDVLKGKIPRFGSSDIAASLIDGHGNLWCGTWGLGLFEVQLATGRVSNYSYDSPLMGYPIAWSLAQGSGDSIWTAAYYDGLMQFDPRSGRFLRHPTVRTESAWHVMRDRQGRIWLGDDRDYLHVIDQETGTSQRFVHDPSNPRSLSHDRARVTYQDPSGRIWVGAGNVVNLWDSASGSFTRFANPEFEEALAAVPLGSDNRGKLWVSYLDLGLGILDPATGLFTNFDASDGLCGVPNEMETLVDGRVLLTGYAGVNILDPDSIKLFRPFPPLVITRMGINDTEVVPPAVLSTSGPVSLTHSQNVVEFEFVAIDIDAPRLVMYRYMLEGLEKDWVAPASRRFVRYTALAPGNYTFKVKASSARSEWPDQEIAYAFYIAPPPWRTGWAYAVYTMVLIGSLYAGYRVRFKQIQLRERVKREHFQAQHLAEVDRLKSRFFANISHEFRTPLTLILGPLRKWQERSPEHEERNDLALAERNAQRLLRLISQLLDLSKLDAGAMKLEAARMNIVPIVKGIASSFESSAGMRGIRLEVSSDRDEIEVWCDRDMLEKILVNLLSNAFKFTPKGGSVSVSIRAGEKREAESAGGPAALPGGHPVAFPQGFVEIAVQDTGIGIPPEELGRVFDRFHQVDASQTREHEGSGIGLSLTKELVDLHRGAIDVRSETGRGTQFMVRLPLGRGHLHDDEIAEAAVQSISSEITDLPHIPGLPTDEAIASAKPGAASPQTTTPDRRRPSVLVIEDNADVRAYLRGYLLPEYEVLEAGNGAEGIARAQESVPDLVISDVMMPRKDGYEVCRTLKLDERTSHIPIILLTAKAGVDDKIEGLETGADDYVFKPFEPKELLARAKNLVDLRRKLREKFMTSAPLRPGEVAVQSTDDAFLHKVQAAVECHIGEEGFSVEDLGREVGLSRSQVLRKLTALTGMSAQEFIRYLRLHRAMDLLKQNAATAGEIAYMVGFSSPAHFTKCFREQFGTTPGEIRRTKQ